MYTALYRTQRPEIFDEIIGQEHIVKILKHQISSGSVGHAYLFCGTRGTGKTTTARILAKGVNCLYEDKDGRPCGKCANCRAISEGSFMDVVEIDAASNNSVDNIRELRESVKYPPAIGRKKVYIIDEVHMLSPGAFNALLKTLEEPPEDVMFILATTESQKLPATILSRCMKFDFKRVPNTLIMQSMEKICSERNVDISVSALKLLANCADGSVRDGLSILDQVLASGESHIDREDVLEYIGMAGEDFFIDLTELVSIGKIPDALILLDEILADGKDVKQLMKDWASHYRNLLITKFIKNPEDILNSSSENIARIKEQSDHITLEEINDAIIRLSRTINEARWSTQPRILLELAVVAIARGISEDSQQVAVRKPQIADAVKLSRTVEPKAKKDTVKPKDSSLSEKKNEGISSNLDYDALWREVLEEGERELGSFHIVRNNASLIDVKEKTFTLALKSEYSERMIEDKIKIIESIMENKLGRSLRLECVVAGEKSISLGDKEISAIDEEECEQKIQDILGIDVEFK